MLHRSPIRSLVALCCLGACATNPAPERAERAAGSEAAEAAATAAADASFASSAPQSDEQRELRALFRELWRQPGFQRQVARSYLRGGEVDPPLTLREGEFRQQVLQLIADDQLDDAEARLRDLQGADANAVWDFMLGNLYFGNGRFEEAARELQKAAAKYPSFRRAWQVLGFAQMRAGDFTAAAQALGEVVGLGGGDAQTFGFLGIAHAQNGDFVAAESAFRMVMMLDPVDDRWQKLLADSLGRQGKYAESAALIGSLIASGQDQDKAELWAMQAYAFAELGRLDEAAANFEVVDRLGRSTYGTLSALGTIYFNQELYDLAVSAYERAMARDDRGDHEVLLGVANRLAARSAYDQAARLVQAIEASYADVLGEPGKVELLKLRARLAVATGATGEQVALLRQIVQQNPLDGDALIQLARHFEAEGEVEQAVFRY